MNGGFALSYSYGFNEYVVIAGGLAEHYRFAGLACHSSERSGRGAGADECRRMQRKPFHACFVAEDAASGAFARRIYGKYGKFAAVFEHMESE